ncbi:hypothetical protein FVE85_0723 [Porphyridium purpureum]|uniref:Uncharacterized protein n=1 Tax=Porphyridium purpureum TaxID=35688 RepID=A0A5J4Z226_PORPP|nr:hypothetical protein FVE85_0723 [Porphyridium purpureum]|eukprot:POR0449..scf208_2
MDAAQRDSGGGGAVPVAQKGKWAFPSLKRTSRQPSRSAQPRDASITPAATGEKYEPSSAPGKRMSSADAAFPVALSAPRPVPSEPRSLRSLSPPNSSSVFAEIPSVHSLSQSKQTKAGTAPHANVGIVTAVSCDYEGRNMTAEQMEANGMGLVLAPASSRDAEQKASEQAADSSGTDVESADQKFKIDVAYGENDDMESSLIKFPSRAAMDRPREPYRGSAGHAGGEMNAFVLDDPAHELAAYASRSATELDRDEFEVELSRQRSGVEIYRGGINPAEIREPRSAIEMDRMEQVPTRLTTRMALDWDRESAPIAIQKVAMRGAANAVEEHHHDDTSMAALRRGSQRLHTLSDRVRSFGSSREEIVLSPDDNLSGSTSHRAIHGVPSRKKGHSSQQSLDDAAIGSDTRSATMRTFSSLSRKQSQKSAGSIDARLASSDGVHAAAAAVLGEDATAHGRKSHGKKSSLNRVLPSSRDESSEGIAKGFQKEKLRLSGGSDAQPHAFPDTHEAFDTSSEQQQAHQGHREHGMIADCLPEPRVPGFMTSFPSQRSKIAKASSSSSTQVMPHDAPIEEQKSPTAGDHPSQFPAPEKSERAPFWKGSRQGDDGSGLDSRNDLFAEELLRNADPDTDPLGRRRASGGLGLSNSIFRSPTKSQRFSEGSNVPGGMGSRGNSASSKRKSSESEKLSPFLATMRSLSFTKKNSSTSEREFEQQQTHTPVEEPSMEPQSESLSRVGSLVLGLSNLVKSPTKRRQEKAKQLARQATVRAEEARQKGRYRGGLGEGQEELDHVVNDSDEEKPANGIAPSRAEVQQRSMSSSDPYMVERETTEDTATFHSMDDHDQLSQSRRTQDGGAGTVEGRSGWNLRKSSTPPSTRMSGKIGKSAPGSSSSPSASLKAKLSTSMSPPSSRTMTASEKATQSSSIPVTGNSAASTMKLERVIVSGRDFWSTTSEAGRVCSETAGWSMSMRPSMKPQHEQVFVLSHIISASPASAATAASSSGNGGGGGSGSTEGNASLSASQIGRLASSGAKGLGGLLQKFKPAEITLAVRQNEQAEVSDVRVTIQFQLNSERAGEISDALDAQYVTICEVLSNRLQ